MAGQQAPAPKADRKKLLMILLPAVGVAAVIVVAAAVMAGGGPKMSDGSNGGVEDPGLTEATTGVKYRDLKEGEGDPVPNDAKVTVKYRGWLSDGKEFDASLKPAEFDLDGGVIAGWTEGIAGMKKKGIRKLVVWPEKGYGGRGSGSKVPPNAVLVFEVELVDFARGKNDGPYRPMSDGSDGTPKDTSLKPLGEGLKYRDLKEGTGPEVPPGATVTIHYTGWVANGTKFDSSHDRDEPATFPLGGLIQGWQKGIPGMKVGGVRKLVIPAPLGYGDRGSPPKIPGGATLVFEIELLGIK